MFVCFFLGGRGRECFREVYVKRGFRVEVTDLRAMGFRLVGVEAFVFY